MQPPPSLWWSQIDATSPRTQLRGDVDVDVAIVGGGYTGLWTARELLRRDPHLRVCVLDAHQCGFGASGRNGGWASALFPASATAVIDAYGIDAYTRQRRLLQEAVVSLGDAAHEEGIECHYARGGTLTFARSPLQELRARTYLEDARRYGVGENDLRWLDDDELSSHARLAGARGALFSPHCARIQPALLARGLALAVERRGATLYENTAVTQIIAGDSTRRARVMTVAGTVRADYVVRATEGFTPTLPRLRREVVPLYSLMIATEPLSDAWWVEYGFDTFPTFSDERHLLVYGQRTADNRIAFGGRGSPYHFGSTVEPRFDEKSMVFAKLTSSLHELFPSLDAEVTHRWGGPLAMPRNKFPSVRVDHVTGLAAAGGYTGDGVTLSYVCANAIADLIVTPDAQTPYQALPFVGASTRRWEAEPWRWIGINAGIALAAWADHYENRRGRPSRATALLERLMNA